jgi:plastocyanin
MGLRRLAFLLVCALLGAAVAVLPAVAGSETTPTTVTAINTEGIYKEQHHYWSPSAVSVGSGAVVAFSNPSAEVKHGLEWTGGPATPSCSGVPGPGATSWHGECTFSRAGSYNFRCTVHPTEMTGAVTVSSSGATTTTTQPPGTTTTTTSTPMTTPATLPLPVAPTLLGGAASAVKLAAGPHGKALRGWLDVSQAGVGGRLEIDVLAKRGALASSGRSARVRVGRFLRSSLPVGRLSFSVPLSSRAKRALARRHRLVLIVTFLLTPPHGATASMTRTVTLHA